MSAPKTTATGDNRLLSFLSLFTSLGTLLCCALPSRLVLLGLGATVASFLSSAPWLVSLSRHKLWVFALPGCSSREFILCVSPGSPAAGSRAGVPHRRSEVPHGEPFQSRRS